MMTPREDHYDAVVIGSGPNGLAAAITLARTFPSVLLLEAKDTIGGGTRSSQITLPGFTHDVCSAFLPLSLASPFFRTLDLHGHGLRWIEPEILLAHPFEDGSALHLERSLEATADGLGVDGEAWQRLFAPLTENHADLIDDILKPVPLPAHPLLMGRFAASALHSARGLAEQRFQDRRTRALFAGLAGHAMIPLDRKATAAFGLVLGLLAHSVGWPLVQGGSQNLADALAERFLELGGVIETGRTVSSTQDLPPATYYFFDVTPRQLANIDGLDLSPAYRRRLGRFRYGPGVFKMDWALDQPVPWSADICRRAGAVHLGASLEEIDASIRDAHAGRTPESPYIIFAQQSLSDPTRAPAGKHTAWAYCHVPHGSTEDISERVESKIERYAPGFRDIVLARNSMSATDMEHYNANYVGGDINGGVQDLGQLYTRPVASPFPYATSNKNVFICSSSTPPGGGVHGLCGYYAARRLSR